MLTVPIFKYSSLHFFFFFLFFLLLLNLMAGLLLLQNLKFCIFKMCSCIRFIFCFQRDFLFIVFALKLLGNLYVQLFIRSSCKFVLVYFCFLFSFLHFFIFISFWKQQHSFLQILFLNKNFSGSVNLTYFFSNA